MKRRSLPAPRTATEPTAWPEEVLVEELEERHRRGYQRHPVPPGEIESWEEVQVWPEE